MSPLGDRLTDYTASDQVGEEAGIIEVFPRNLLKCTIGALDRASVKVPNADVGLKEIEIVVVEDCGLLKECRRSWSFDGPFPSCHSSPDSQLRAKK